MKKILVLAFAFMAFNGYAQIKTPAASPKSTVTQAFGLTEVTIEYSRPSVKNRTIFSDEGLVPYGKVWRTGANQATKITFGSDVQIGGSELPAGSYAITCTPNATSFNFHIHNYEKSSWSSYKDKEPKATVSVTPQKMNNMVETFTFNFANMTSNSMDIEMMWADVKTTMKVSAAVDEVVMSSIDKVMAGPSKGDYYQAANYYYENGKNLNQALNWINKATAGDDPKFWQVRKKALILADMGKFKEALTSARESLKLAETAGNEDYVRMNEASIKEWMSKRVQKN